MSSDSVIEEDILEEIDNESEVVDDNAEAVVGGPHLKDKDKGDGIERKSAGHFDNDNIDGSLNGGLNAELEAHATESKQRTDGVKEIGDKISKSIINYSGLLAENVLQEALLINEIYAKDVINQALDEDSVSDRDKEIRKHLFPNENGRILSKDNGSGYDGYLLDKLLRSKADPEEISEIEGFDGLEENFRIKEEKYPGLDSDDAYVKAELDRTITDRELSDKNNNQMALGLSDPFDDNILQTIHEDTELVIEDSFRVNNEGPIQEVAGANMEQLAGNEKDIEGDELEDEKSIDEGIPQELDKLPEEAPVNDDEELIKKILNDDADDVSEGENDNKPIEEVPVEEDVEDDTSDDEETGCCEMTLKQKKAIVKAVRKGNINLLEKLLEKKNADMGMTWYGENLLMVAVRSQKQEMAEFLIDNGIDWRHETKLVEVNGHGTLSIHKITARQVAYDLNMEDLVELLDYKMDNLFPFVRPKPRIPRLRQPIIPFAPPPLDEAMNEEFMIGPDEARVLQKQATEQYKQRQREIELENLEMMQRRRKGLTSGAENESVHTAKSKHTCSDLNIINDDISQVFGPDEGYETMSPVSPHRHDFRVADMKENVSIRATRAFHLKKAFNALKTDHLKRMDSPDYPIYQNNYIDSVGSYNFESRRWHHPMSAPQLRNYSTESLPDQSVHTGLPFVRDGNRKIMSASSDRPKTTKQRRSQSAHSNISPYSQVAKLLEQSRLFSPVLSSRATTPYFPAIASKKSNGSPQTKTRINYIYADRSSAKPKRSDFSPLKSDLLPKRKLKL